MSHEKTIMRYIDKGKKRKIKKSGHYCGIWLLDHRSWNARPVRNFRDYLAQFPILLKWEMRFREIVIQGHMAWLVTELTQSPSLILLFNYFESMFVNNTYREQILKPDCLGLYSISTIY